MTRDTRKFADSSESHCKARVGSAVFNQWR